MMNSRIQEPHPVPTVRLKNNVEATTSAVNDYLELGTNLSFREIARVHNDNSMMKNIYSDTICRINSLGERNIKFIAITGKCSG